MSIDEKAFQAMMTDVFIHPFPDREVICRQIIEAYETAKASGQPVDCALIEQLKARAKSAEANPELYRDGWECAIKCAINLVREHKRESIYQNALGLAYALIERDYQEEDPTTGRYIAKVAEPAWNAICEALYGKPSFFREGSEE